MNKYPSTLANLTLVLFIYELLKISNFISFKSKNIVKYNSEYLDILHWLK
jgi:hypothetical protein